MHKPNFSYYKNAEVVQFTDNVITIINKNDPPALKIAAQATALDSQFQELRKLFIIDQGNAITEEIQGLDSTRDDDLIGINLLVDSYQKHFDPEKIEAHKLLRALLDKHGRDLYKRSYAEETAGIRSMVNEVESTPALSTAAALLHLMEWFDHLKSVNDLFDQKFLERNEAYAEAPKENFSELRARTEAAYDELAKHLAAHAIISPSEAYDKVISQIEQLVASYNQTVKSRISSGTSEDDMVTE